MTYSDINDSFINLIKLIFCINFVRYTINLGLSGYSPNPDKTEGRNDF